MESKEFIRNFLEENIPVSTDTRTIKKGDVFFALKGDNFDGNEYVEDALKKGASWAITENDGYKENERCIVVKDSLKYLQELANAYRHTFKVPVIAITGSNGKTTTKELCTSVLQKRYRTHATKGNYNNHIGVPLTLLAAPRQSEILIIEMGANHQGEIAALCAIAEPDYGLITNIGKAHLEGFGGIKGVIKGKTELYRHLDDRRGTIFYNDRDSLLPGLLPDNTDNKPYEPYEMIQVNPSLIISSKETVYKSQLFGNYNATNIMSAVTLGRFFGVAEKDMQKAISQYRPQNNRSEIIEFKGARFIKDAYNANPTSMEASIMNFAQSGDIRNKILILGDMLELGDKEEVEHLRMVDLIKKAGFQKVLLIGPIFGSLDVPYDKYDSAQGAKDAFLKLDIKGKEVLVKGSRKLELEKIIG